MLAARCLSGAFVTGSRPRRAWLATWFPGSRRLGVRQLGHLARGAMTDFLSIMRSSLQEAGVFDKMGEYDDASLPGDWRWTCTACPVQAEGHLADGGMGYFRARHGEWSFEVSPGPTDDARDAVFGHMIDSGDDPHSGFAPVSWALPTVLACIEKAGGARL